MINNIRTISKVYIVQTIKDNEIVKICSNRELAEYYRKLLQPKYYELFDKALTIESYDLVHFKTEKVQISQDEYIEVVQDNMKALEKLNNIKKIIWEG